MISRITLVVDGMRSILKYTLRQKINDIVG